MNEIESDEIETKKIDVALMAQIAVAADVLSRHGITVDEWGLRGIALYLAFAREKRETFAAEMWRFKTRDQAARLERINTLDAVIAVYQERINLAPWFDPAGVPRSGAIYSSAEEDYLRGHHEVLYLYGNLDAPYF